jgi:undecaprenyl-diphosphatase
VTTVQLWEISLLGALQGLTEFLPISSSGHLVVAQQLLPNRTADPVTLEVALHAGTLAAVLVYFAADIGGLVRGFIQPAAGPAYARRLVWLIALATLPALVAYVVAGRWIESTFESLVVVGANLLVTAAVLASVANAAPGAKGEGDLTALGALIIGVAQSAALLPGISRSGATIAAGMALGLRGDAAARLSFLLAIPAISGAELVKLPLFIRVPVDDMVMIGVGMAVAAITGWLAIDVLLRLVRRGKLGYFATYCAVVGALTLWGGLVGW